MVWVTATLLTKKPHVTLPCVRVGVKIRVRVKIRV
jgi:hypothetical protein